MRRTIPPLLCFAAAGLVGCVAEIPELPDEYQNKAPVINGDMSHELTEGSVHQIEMSISDDRDSLDDLEIDWAVAQQTEAELAITPDGTRIEVTVPWQTSGQQSARLALTVTDQDGETTEAELELTIRKQTFVVAQAEKEQSDKGDLYKVGYPAADTLHLNDTIDLQESLEQPTLSPNGQYLAFIRKHDVDGEQLVLTETNGSEEQPVALETEENVQIINLSWSDDSRWLAVVTQTTDLEPEYHLQLVDSEASVTPVITSPGLKTSTDFRFSDDEQHLAWRNASGELVWSDLTSNTPTTLYAADEDGFTDNVTYQWHPTLNRLAYTAVRDASGSNHLYLATPETLEDSEPPAALSSAYGSHVHTLKNVQWSPTGQYLSFTADLLEDEQFDLFVLDWQAQLEDEGANTQTRINSTLVDDGDVSDYQWSPGEQRLAYEADQIVDRENQLFSSTVEGGGNRQLTDFGTQSETLYWDWASDSSIIVAMSEINEEYSNPASHQISVYDVHPEQTVQYTRLTRDLYHNDEPDRVDDIQMSPDHSQLALQSLIISTQQVQGHVLNFETGELQQFTDLTTQESNHDYLWSPNSDALLYLTLNGDDEGIRLIHQPLESLPETVSESLLGELAPNGRILDVQIAQ